MPATNARDVTFLELHRAVLCVECELVSYNNTASCLACGSRAVLSLSRVLGGSLRDQNRIYPAKAKVLDQVVSDVLNLVKAPVMAGNEYASVEPATDWVLEDATALAVPQSVPTQVASAMDLVVDRARSLTGATGAALALSANGRMLCQARSGSTVPDLGVEVRPDSGLSGLCLRTHHTWRCNTALHDSRVNQESCRQLGIESIVVAPVAHLDKVLGLLEVLSPEPHAFDDAAVATVQLLADVTMVAIARGQIVNAPILPVPYTSTI